LFLDGRGVFAGDDEVPQAALVATGYLDDIASLPSHVHAGDVSSGLW